MKPRSGTRFMFIASELKTHGFREDVLPPKFKEKPAWLFFPEL